MQFHSIDRAMERILVADFTKYPGGRYRKHGDGSGEEFRDTKLVPALTDHREVTVVLDDVAGYPASFLEEAFGGLIREKEFNLEQLKSSLHIKADDDLYSVYVDLAWEYIEDAAKLVAAPK